MPERSRRRYDIQKLCACIFCSFLFSIMNVSRMQTIGSSSAASLKEITNDVKKSGTGKTD